MAASTKSIFYSWQSDSPARFNRTFIEEALKTALRNLTAGTALDPSPRDLELEKDTLNVPGSPPITDTILRKIDACSVFVADLTVVGQTLPALIENGKEAKLFPNSNVVMEYGYALKSHDYPRIIAVTNEAFGGTVRERTLPFNLRYRRWPIRYQLGVDTLPADKKRIKDKLVADLTDAIGLVLREPRIPAVALEQFVESDFTPHTFVELAKSHELLIDGPYREDIAPYEIPSRGLIYLRLQPTVQVPPFESEIDAKNTAWSGELLPMAGYKTTGRSPARNVAGGIVYQAPSDDKLRSFTQLFLSKEIYGIDARSSGGNMWRNAKEEHPLFDIGAVEESFAITLRNYVTFAANKLNLPAPWKVRAGVIGVKGHKIQGACCLRNEITWSTAMAAEFDILDTLTPFFELLWKNFGARRPDNARHGLKQMIVELNSRK